MVNEREALRDVCSVGVHESAARWQHGVLEDRFIQRPGCAMFVGSIRRISVLTLYCCQSDFEGFLLKTAFIVSCFEET